MSCHTSLSTSTATPEILPIPFWARMAGYEFKDKRAEKTDFVLIEFDISDVNKGLGSMCGKKRGMGRSKSRTMGKWKLLGK